MFVALRPRPDAVRGEVLLQPRHNYSLQRNPVLVSPATLHTYYCSASTLQIMDHLPKCFCWHRCLWYGTVLSCLAWNVIYRPYGNKYVNFQARSLIIPNKTIQKRMHRWREEIAVISWPSIRLESFPAYWKNVAINKSVLNMKWKQQKCIPAH